MALVVAYIERFEDVVPRAVAFLSAGGDLFARPRIVVPTAGARAWLHDRLARELGTSGQARGDGVVVGVEFSFPGAIAAILQPSRDSRLPDPWSLDRLTFAVLDEITGPVAEGFGIPFDVAREPLLAARRIAGLFDEYHARRPGMILEWDRGKGNPVLAPTANDVQVDGHALPASLRETDLWQFRVWRAVRDRIGSPAPPARRSVGHQSPHAPLLVAGLESLSLPQLECLESLAQVCDVEVLLVHPSPGLRQRWAVTGQQPLPADLRDRPLQKLRDPVFPEGVDPLLPVWLSGARELHDLLAARGTAVAERPPDDVRPDGGTASLLHRMQRSIAAGGAVESAAHDLGADRSVSIHRCHSLSRQAEVLHDALLQAFAEIPDLEPHEVAIVSPCLEQAAPHLAAVFQRTVGGYDSSGAKREISLPLVVADRGIRETSAAADLLVALLGLPGSRASIDDVLGVAAHPLIRTAFGIDDEAVAAWTDLVERTSVRWGFDSGHRGRHGLELTTDRELHTWKLGLERMVLGALLPDAVARPELGGVVPLADLDPVDLTRIAALVRILDVIRGLDAATSQRRAVAVWCDLIEQALVGLCGEECPELVEPLAELRRLRDAAAGTAGEAVAVPYEDVHRLLVTWCEDRSGRQPLGTGAITATSMVPLRGVPFRVIGVIGYDDGAVGAGEADGDDLVSRQQLVGDVDARADERRALLDCVLAARERLVITCNGRSVKSNKRVPLVTPLAELVDFAVRHGVAREKFDEPSGIEIDHPRHHLSRRNFENDGVLPGGFWSHDRVACEVIAGRGLGQPVERRVDAAPASAPAVACGRRPDVPRIEFSLLEKLVQDPLKLFLEKTLGIDTWRGRDDGIPATIPLVLGSREIRDAARQLVDVLVAEPTAAADWGEALRRSGRLPYGPLAERQLAEIRGLAQGLVEVARADGIPLQGTHTLDLTLDLGDAILVGTVPGVHEATRQLVDCRAGTAKKDAHDRPLHVAALRLLAARAAGADVTQAAVLARHRSWEPGAVTDAGKPIPAAITSTVLLASGVDPRERLRELCSLARLALAGPCGLFGLRDSAHEDRPADFETFVAARPWGGGAGGYAGSTEAMVYGMTPAFDEVFAPASRELAFLDRFAPATALHGRRGTSEYTLA